MTGMLARLEQLTTVSLIAAALGWAAWFLHREQPAWAVLGALFIAFGYALFLALEFVLVWCVHGDDPAPKPTVAQLFRAWAGEVLSAPRVFCWQQPFRSRLHPDHLMSTAKKRGVVLVHGFVCNRGFWNRWMQRLRKEDIPYIAVNLEPVFGSIDHYAPIVDQAVRRMQEATQMAPVVVGHSMGGLAIRAWRTAFHANDRMHRVITIGSPHRGTWLGRFGTSTNSREMHMGSDWQHALEASESGLDFDRFTCIYSNCDNIVFPTSNATLPGAHNRHIGGVAHVHLIDQPEVINEVLAWVAPVSVAKPSEAPVAPLAQ